MGAEALVADSLDFNSVRFGSDSGDDARFHHCAVHLYLILMKKLWEKWKEFSLIIGSFMSRLILSIIYFTLILPYGLGVRFFSDPLAIKSIPRESGWKPYPGVEPSLQNFQQQY